MSIKSSNQFCKKWYSAGNRNKNLQRTNFDQGNGFEHR